MTIGATFGNALRSTGKRATVGTINKTAKGYGKANKKVGGYAKAGARKGVSYFQALATKFERDASKKRGAKRKKQSRQLRAIK